MPYSFAVEPSISSFATSRTEQGVLRSGPVKSSQWNQIQLDGLYQLVVCEVRQDGITYPLDRGSRQAFAVASVLDLGLRMLESPRGRDCLASLAHKAIRIWRERPVPDPTRECALINVGEAVNEFLRSVRHSFPLVKLNDRNGFCRDESSKRDFSAWTNTESSSSSRQFSFDPKAAAVLHLNSQLVRDLYLSRLKASTASRHHPRSYDNPEQRKHTARFRRFQLHLAAMVTHHLCHLFVNFLRQQGPLALEVTDADMMRLVSRYDPGAEFEVEFFGGRLKLFIDWQQGNSSADEEKESYEGKSYVIRRGGKGKTLGGGATRRVAALVAEYKIESYLSGDFSIPLLSEVEGDVLELDWYHDIKRKYSTPRNSRSNEGSQESRRVAEIGSLSYQLTLTTPWSIQGEEYEMLKKTSLDPDVCLAKMEEY
ncbi:uncharacterized protein CTHT_0073100 [Thermochaetoides thermophila DSM 1495]|uniref:Uncharacterized protein n=1 Tax=Chaetomium thermophilum (strain DSM 1495 / CBS 144.50 / IMI 039719) TaxID=759272 RepID=G0SHR5_CHATD|nr:hypothetical protein CTHT_0073100 [Thermochaetoides thermophila DSM 1495]EGS16985.1 hypothetical protein CTHT_0073100 [Thermochaetoides thermophila DSM 1495]